MGAGSEGIVKGEEPGLQLPNADAVLGAGVMGGVFVGLSLALARNGDDHKIALALPQCRFHGIGQAGADILTHYQAVNDQFDGVLFVFIQPHILHDIRDHAVHTGTDVSVFHSGGKDLLVASLFAADHGREHHKPLSLGELQNGINDLIHAALADLPTADGAVRHADAGVQQTKIVVYLRDGAHGGAGILAGGFLIDSDGRGKPLDGIHLGLVQLSQEHTGIGGQGLHEAAVSLRVEGIECQGRFTRARQAGEHHQLAPGDRQINIFQIMHPRTADNDFVHIFTP